MNGHEVVQQKKFVNVNEKEINEWLATIPPENVISASFHVVGFESGTDEYTTVFYRGVLWI